MTCIVGIVDKGEVVVVGDSAGVSALDMRVRLDAKVWLKDGFVYGCTTSFRMIQILRYNFHPPKRHPETDVLEYMATSFIDGVRKALKDGGWAKKDSEMEVGGQFLVGHAGRLFMIDGDYQVGEAADGFDACGCGESYALGALRATPSEPTDVRLQRAMEAAEHFSAGVRGPFVTVRLRTA